ncbi:hypothetical protein BRD15_04410 [Halobacteriales archaeon SW_6_65_15]|nr:MAG: hypothetical protein BRD15_04410 [Halobacteriales archaeon SW_6_65_15]
MATESITFGLSTLVTVVGLLIMLYGVKLTDGLAVSTPMIIGGVVVLGAIGLHTAGLMALDDPHDAA